MPTENKKNIKEPFKTYFEEDLQFKALDIKEFTAEKSWIIENWWTEEEKINIGLIKNQNIVTIGEFQDLLMDTMNMILKFKEDLECMK